MGNRGAESFRPAFPGGSVRVLVTTDTFSGVWTYTRELVSGLVTQGAQVVLVSFGEIPLPHQTGWMQGLHGLEYHPTAFRLDWMQEGEQDFHAAQDYLCSVIHDTRPDLLHLNQLSFVTKEESVLAIGRLWDTGKQVALLTQHSHGMPVCIVGADHTIPAPPVPIRADVRVSTGTHEISVKGAQTESQLRTLYSKSTIFAATSRYEPVGLASIEAAFSRCALVANDTPVYRELWGDAALYFECNDAESLTETLAQLHEDREMARLYGTRAYNRARERFTARRMVDDYLRLYRQLRTSKVAVA